MNSPPDRASLQAIIERCGLHLSPAQYDQIWAYHKLLRAANAELNLTRIHNFENMVLKNYVDSLLVLRFEELPSPLLDLGSGAGLPGIPLKIASPQTHIILAEPRGARALFLRDVCEALALDQIEVYDRKVGPGFPRKVAGVITRAVAAIPETLDLVADCLEPGGRMLFMKGPGCDAEIAQAEETHAGAFRLVANHSYTIPGTTHDRRLVVYERLEGRVRSRAAARAPSYAGPIREVTSETNPTFKVARELLSGRGIRKHGQALLAGTRSITEVLARYRDRVLGWLTGASGPPPPDEHADLLWIRLADPLFRELDTAGTHAPLLLVQVPAFAEWSDSEAWPQGCTLFIPFQDPENVGAVIRSAVAFGVARVVLLREAAHPFHPKSARAAGPALFQVPLLQGPSIHELKAEHAPLIALATDGPELGAEPFPDIFGLVVGVEGPGLPEPLRTGTRLRIPIAVGVESLNAAAAVAVALYEWRRENRASVPS
ncbi:MAG TPA: 16S rRNA (guanine(527)-N(7))-methyltransferase RsmG [Isosphaeraceae bacterium]|jgi:16S rRNA (guanine527-N7)-methyltransferase|nr:16S rRNA (guanine(527)-N(7))-methyltransferase RsmG [Isosphaeraceae bacterium]